MTAADAADPGDRFRPVSAEAEPGAEADSEADSGAESGAASASESGAEATTDAPADASTHAPAQPDRHADVRDLDPAPAPAPAPAAGVTTMQSGGGAGGGYGVSTTELGKMADELDEAARLLEQADKGLSESENTARIHSMLAAGRMLSGTTSAWAKEVARLAKQCRSLADKMRDTHTAYTTQEQRTAQEFEAILAGFERGA
ncbi:hypothetical protein [Streptomyces luteolus]|uniref:Uncharacterized protein n=1 Tax=Streptomyces luteolus TaxID=3043615 RepID=A0ABT6SYZ0_9ACTN|nr:hypothetical protein [Streptomyces sp. B-S-A12]MDI3420338.1 hypothetical protein [Streptomyces sp. B-S-A12]